MFSKPVNLDAVSNSVFLLDRYTDTAIGFEFFSENSEPNSRIGCNKVFTENCIVVPQPIGIDIIKVEFLAGEDPCFKILDIFKKSEDNTVVVELQRDTNDNLTGVIIRFFKYESGNYPFQMAYRLYGFDSGGSRIVLSQGLICFK